MKAKLLAFGVALFSAAIVGLTQLQTNAAQPGQVGDAPRCTVTATKASSKAFEVSGNTATVNYKVTGAKNCKAQITISSFYAPAMDGKPWSEQILYKRMTKVVKRSSDVQSWSVALPAKSTKAKGCYYQVDLSYGTHNILPLIGYGHGKLDCSKKQPKQPAASCKALTITPLERTKFRFGGSVNLENGATLQSYTYTVVNSAGTQIFTQTTAAATLDYTQNTPGSYRAKLTANTSVGPQTNTTTCEQPFTVTPAEKPGVTITKTINGKKSDTVALNQPYDYKLTVTNTGTVTLTNVSVSDPAPRGVQFLSAAVGTIADNKWSYTIESLGVGESQSFTITAKVVEEQSSAIRNTACVDAPQVPGSPDACDNADVTVPPKVPGKVVVCDPSTGKIISVDEGDEDQYAPVNSDKCKEKPAPTPTPETPAALPVTGPTEAILKMLGAGSLTGAATYYIASRRNS